MFDLESAISHWRKQMLAAGIKTPVPLDELESHLRDEVERQSRDGATAEAAFQNAVERLGKPAALKSEFAKAVGMKRALGRKWKNALLRFLGLAPAARFPSLDNFTDVARESLVYAGEEPRRFRHDFIGTEHVLLGLLRTENCLVPKVLRRIGVSQEAIRSEIEKFVGVGPLEITAQTIPYTPRARQALQLAAREAEALRHAQVGAEHIFLGLLVEGSGVAAVVLRGLGVDIQQAREAVLGELNPRPGQA